MTICAPYCAPCFAIHCFYPALIDLGRVSLLSWHAKPHEGEGSEEISFQIFYIQRRVSIFSRGFAISRRTRLVVSTTAMSASIISEAKAQQELLQELKKRKAVQYELLGTSWDRSVTYATANPHYIRCSLERNILEYLGIMLSKADLYGPAAV